MKDKRKSKRLAKIRAAWRSYNKEIKKVKVYDKENVIKTYSKFEEVMRTDDSLVGKTNKAKVKYLVDLAQYQTDYKTARRYLKKFKDTSKDYEEQLEAVRAMHTHELYDLHKAEIEAFKTAQRNAGMSNRDVAEAVSTNFFGS